MLNKRICKNKSEFLQISYMRTEIKYSKQGLRLEKFEKVLWRENKQNTRINFFLHRGLVQEVCVTNPLFKSKTLYSSFKFIEKLRERFIQKFSIYSPPHMAAAPLSISPTTWYFCYN